MICGNGETEERDDTEEIEERGGSQREATLKVSPTEIREARTDGNHPIGTIHSKTCKVRQSRWFGEVIQNVTNAGFTTKVPSSI
jgi:hypothetical protein